MKRRLVTLLAMVLLISIFDPAFGDQQMPEVMYNSDPYVQSPVWVSAAAAIDAGGHINEKLFPEPSRFTIESYFSGAPINGCFAVGESFEDRVDPPDRSSLDRAARHSALIVLGRISGVANGFHFHVPGQLLRIEPNQVLKGEAPLDAYYIFFPVGAFEAGPYSICKSDSRYPELPQIGDELLVMVPAHRIRALDDPYLELEEASSVVVIPEGEAPDLPEVFETSADDKSVPEYQNKAELVVAVKKALEEGESAL